jgi:two-component system, OmpR family, phosphate regulon sensor histidine kinase PhoR
MHRPSARSTRQLILLLGVVVVPSAVLMALGARAYRQEQALASQSRTDTRRQLAGQLAGHLVLTLGQIRLQQTAAVSAGNVAPQHPAVVNTSLLSGGHVKPMEARRARSVPADFAAAIRLGESAEFGGRGGEAAGHYSQALSLARDTALAAHARLHLARALTATGRSDSAARHYRWLLSLPFHVADDEDIPFALYAAERLRTSAAHRQAVAERVRQRLDRETSLPRLESYLLRDIAESLAVAPEHAELRAMAVRHLAIGEQLAALYRDLPTLLRLRTPRAAQAADGTVWIPYGDPLWLVSAAPIPGSSDSAVIVVEVRQLERVLESELSSAVGGGVHIVADPDTPDSEPLGPTVPGLHAVLAVETPEAQRPRILLAALFLLVGLSALSGHLLWRDVRRESRAAALRSRFVSAVSHELKTPLTSIRMFAEMLRMRPEDSANRGAFLDTIVGESERLTRLIENVLHFSRLEESRQAYRFVPTDLRTVVHDAAQAMTYPIGQEGLQLHLEADAHLPLQPLDRDAMMQAVLNLLSNAVKFSPPGGCIELRLERRNGEATIAVRDQGIGIDNAEHIRIFEEFYRSPDATARGVEGTGLGLALVSDVVRAHGGRVAVDSTPGEGSTFTIILPLTPE